MFSYSIDYTREDDSHGGLIAAEPTLTAAIDAAAKDLAYYRAQGYTAVLEWIAEDCPACDGRGETKSGKRWRPCKACKSTSFDNQIKESSQPLARIA